MQEALALWEDRERQTREFLLTLDHAKASLARGEGRVVTEESMRQLADEVKSEDAPAFSPNSPRAADGANADRSLARCRVSWLPPEPNGRGSVRWPRYPVPHGPATLTAP